MSDDVKRFERNHLLTTHFCIQLDKSVLNDNEALLLAYVCYVMDQEIHSGLSVAYPEINLARRDALWLDAEIRLRVAPRPLGRPKGLSDDGLGRSPSKGVLRAWVGSERPTGGGGSPALS
ncbi:hypothetical protein NPIL_101811 [Nephila pilipes]|uniref:Uncharacterized protein n=1 Tax=Nephila pilipes TaxID=299642 RepID=A0A8X6U2U4_NEPPI|nr:hypothetical protein NPIL_101811 [Nephila pilipes]